MSRRLVAVALLLLAAGCSDASGPASSQVPPTSAPASPSASTSTTASASATALVPPAGTRSVVQCLNGTYRLTRLVDVAGGAAYRSGRGGDVELRFSGEEFPDGNYVGTAYALVGAGKRALTLTGADSSTARLVVAAKGQGSYTLEGSRATFAVGPGKGSGRLSAGGTTTTLSLAEVEAIVAPVGLLTVSCTDSTLWLTGETKQYELASV